MISSYPCPKGHPSSEPDYCSECGVRILPLPEPSLQQVADPLTCPDCSSTHDRSSGDFCEICGYNFVTQAHGEIPIPISHPPVVDEPIKQPDSLPPPPPPIAWEIRMTIDRVPHDPASPPAPPEQPACQQRLQVGTHLIGRTSQLRAIYPAIALDFDDAVSHRHALLTLAADGSLTLRDIGSSNGTWLNGREIRPMTDHLLKPGDEVTLGHWSRIQIQAAAL